MSAERVRAAYETIERVDRPEVWISLREEAAVTAEMTRGSAVRPGPLAGLLVAVKNNVDVEGLPTTAGCPSYASAPAAQDATAVARLRAAGATVMGATNLDQFATGLVGQRSPYGAVRDARRPTYISGGSSSGSAVAVALGLADLAVGTDTAGSGRVPAAFQGIIGIKPTLGVVSTQGVVPACRSWDAVTIFARDLETAAVAMGAMAGGPGTRPWPLDVPLAAPQQARIAVPDHLTGMADGWTEAFGSAVERLSADGCIVETIDLDVFLAAARLLYDGALVAERHAAVGAFVDEHPDACDPTVAKIIGRAGSLRATDLVQDLARLEELRAEALVTLAGFDALMVPTSPGQPTQAQVAADPVGVNSWVGTYTNFCNLFDFCAVAVPAGVVDEAEGRAQFGVTLLAPAFHDAVVMDLARRVAVLPTPPSVVVGLNGRPAALPDPGAWPVLAGAESVRMFVVGAHRRGQPLEEELRGVGARWVGPAATAATYSLTALATIPPKPGLTRVASGGVSITGELWDLSSGALGRFLAGLPAPMMLGSVALDDGSSVIGFGCSAESVAQGHDITATGDWVRHLANSTPPI